MKENSLSERRICNSCGENVLGYFTGYFYLEKDTRELVMIPNITEDKIPKYPEYQCLACGRDISLEEDSSLADGWVDQQVEDFENKDQLVLSVCCGEPIEVQITSCFAPVAEDGSLIIAGTECLPTPWKTSCSKCKKTINN